MRAVPRVRAIVSLCLVIMLLVSSPVSFAEQWLDRVRDEMRVGNALKARALLQEQGVSLEDEEISFLMAETYRREGDLRAAAEKLGKSGDGFLSALGYFNLGADYSQIEERTSRARVSLAVARAMAEAQKTTMAADLMDRARALEGLVALQNDNPGRALDAFHRVRADSYITPVVLYLAGVAQARDGNLRRALQSWEQVRYLPMPYRGVGEARLATIWAHTERGHYRQALISSAEARSAFENSIESLEVLRARVAEHGPRMVLRDVTARNDELVEYLRDSRNIASNTTLAWFFQFMETPQSMVREEQAFTREFLDFLGAQQNQMQRFRDQTLYQQAVVYELIARQENADMVRQTGGRND